MLQKRIKQPYDAFLAGFEEKEENLFKNPKLKTVTTQDDKDFLDGFYADEPDHQRPQVTLVSQKQPTVKQPNITSNTATDISYKTTTYKQESPKLNNGKSTDNTSPFDSKLTTYLQNAAKGASYALSGGTSLRNEPQKANNYTQKYTNSESKLISFLNTKQTTQSKPQYNDFWDDLTAGAGYYNSGGMSANWQGADENSVKQTAYDFRFLKDAVKEGIGVSTEPVKDFAALNAYNFFRTAMALNGTPMQYMSEFNKLHSQKLLEEAKANLSTNER